MIHSVSEGKRPILFVLLVFVLSIPSYWLGSRSVLPASFHIYAPAMIFATFIPASLANLFLYREGGWDGVRRLWRNVFDVKRIGNWRWCIPIFLLMPAAVQ